MHPEHPSVPLPPRAAVTDTRGNRAARRGKRSGTTPDAHARNAGGAHARGAQGRRINPVRRTG